ncbi:hypothetical protein [uncultured Hymenobacter sp.]|uniref:hypothetical protein n=1 Tax=uncultured Hymenobacter sp. TaxID=170016 RepID=UPI0035CB4A1F
MQYSPTGQQGWVRCYNSGQGGSDRATNIAVDATGSVVVTGLSATVKYAGGSEVWVVRHYATAKYAATTGQPLWTTRYNGPDNGTDRAMAIAVTTARDVYVTGNSVGNGTGSDYATIRYVQATDLSSGPLVAATRTGAVGAGSISQELAVYPSHMVAKATVSLRPHLDGVGQVQFFLQPTRPRSGPTLPRYRSERPAVYAAAYQLQLSARRVSSAS